MLSSVFRFAVSQLQMVSALQEYSTLWDERHQSLLKAAQNHESIVATTNLVEVNNLYRFKDKFWLVGDFDTHSDYWINRCAV